MDFKEHAPSKRAWDRLKQRLQRATRSKNEAIAEAAQSLLDILGEMERSPTVFVVQVRNMNDEWERDNSAGVEACGKEAPVCWITIDSRPKGPMRATRILTSLAHEAGGAWGSLHGVDHYSDAVGALLWENKARTAFACGLRQTHDPSHIPPPCR